MASAKRSKTFATLIYPESVSGSSRELVSYLETLHVSYLVSPIHNLDIDAERKTKKPHWHVILVFDSLKSIPQVKDILPACCVGLEIVNSLTSYARYLVHLDNPDKAQYNVRDVISYGLDYQELIRKVNDKYEDYARILDIVVSKRITSFASLLLWAKDNDKAVFHTLCDNSYTIREFIRSYVSDCNKSGALKIK